MKTLLIFPPGWNPCGPYLALPLLKGYLEAAGHEFDILDLNIELFDWALSAETINGLHGALVARERLGKAALGAHDYARVCMALLRLDHLADTVEVAKGVMRTPHLFNDDSRRAEAQRTIAEALDLVSAAFEGVSFSTQQIYFKTCGLNPEMVAHFAEDPDNLIRRFCKDLRPQLPNFAEYDLIGFSVACWEQLAPAVSIAQSIRDQGFAGHICFGGNYTTRMIKTWQKCGPYFTYQVDSYSLYEGEHSLAKLIEVVGGTGELSDVPNLAYFEDGRLVSTGYVPVPVSDLPPPDFDGFPLQKYLMPELILPVFASRGCGYKCAFCSIPYASGKFQRRDELEVVREVGALQAKYGTRHFTFVDEILTLETLEHVADHLIASDLDIRWYGETRFHPKMTGDKTAKLFASGCRKLQFGMESYSQRVLNLMRKGTKVEQMLPNIEACLQSAIAVHLFAIIGFPGETEEEALLTKEFCNRIMSLSEETYGLPYSTVGLSPFRLSFFSDVHLNPERYGVELVDLRETDAPLDIFSIDYRTRIGLSPEEAEVLALGLGTISASNDLKHQLGMIDLCDVAQPHVHEEEGFLLYIFREETLVPKGRPHAPEVGLRTALAPTFDLEVQLAPQVVVADFSADFHSYATDEEPSVALYDPTHRMLVQCPQHMFDTLRIRARAAKCDSNHLDGEATAVLSRLIYNGLVTAKGMGLISACSGAQTAVPKEVTVVPNPDIYVDIKGENGFYLIDRTLCSVTELGAFLAWLVNRLSGTPIRKDVLQGKVRESFPDFPASRLDAALLSLNDAGAVNRH